MAKVTGPLFSMKAAGQLGKALVMSNWKGIKTARGYTVPANPRTADQVTQRDLFTVAVYAIRNYLNGANLLEAWNRVAAIAASAMSGFNSAVKAIIKIATTNPDASFGQAAVAFAGRVVRLTLKNVDDGAVGDEAGNFEVLAAQDPKSLVKVGDVAIVAGLIDTPVLGTLAGEIWYVALRKDGEYRSGIYQVTLLA